MSLSQTPDSDDSWYVKVDCPQYFDFCAALQAPCSTDLMHNPPLHDFVYESDDESRRFFRSAHLLSPPPQKLEQPSLLDPRDFGEPIYRHRPETSFNEFLRDFETRKKASANSVSDCAADASNVTEHITQQLERSTPAVSKTFAKVCPSKPPAFRNLGELNEDENDEDQDLTTDLRTPTLDSIITPVSVRRNDPLLTPSRIFHPINISKDLFASSFDSAVSSAAKSSERTQGGLAASPLAENFRSPELEGSSNTSGLHSNHSNHSKKTSPTSCGISTPLRTTPVVGSHASVAELNSGTKERFLPETCDNRAGSGSQEQRIGPPRRAARPSPSVASTESVSPTISFTQSSTRIDSGPSIRDSAPARNMPTVGVGLKTQSSARRLARQRSQQDLSNGTNDHEGSQASDCEESALIKRVQEHNMKLQKSERGIGADFKLPNGSDKDSGRALPCRQSSRRCSGSDVIRADERSHPKSGDRKLNDSQSMKSQMVPADARSEDAPRSLKHLLQVENDRILRERKERLPERRKVLQSNKNVVLKQVEEHNFVPPGRRKRITAAVEFTSAETSRTLQGRPRDETIVKQTDQRRNLGTDSKAVPFKHKDDHGASSTRGQSRGPGIPSARVIPASRQLGNQISVTEQIKASAKQRRQEKRIENDLQSILSQHNRRVQNNRRLQT